MLTLTENAQAAVQGLTAQSDLPDGAGVRIAMAGTDQLELSLAPAPQDGDEVVGTEDARVFVAEETSPLLSNHTLDAGETPQGVGFTLHPND